MKFNPRTNRFENVQAPLPQPNEISDYWLENTRGDTDSRLAIQSGLNLPVGDAKDSPLYRTPTQLSANAPATQTTPAPSTDFNIDELMDRYKDDPLFSQLIGTLFGAGGSGGSGGPSRADRQRAARTVQQAGRQAKKDYTRLGEEGFARTMGEAEKYYGGRETTARGQIDDATRNFLNNLVAPTAYSSAPLPNMQVQEQGLGESLGAYGATGDLARQQRTSSQGDLDFANQLATRSMGQLNTAQTNYLDAVRNAGLGAQAAARTGLTQNLESMRGMTRAQADAVRQQLLQQGIEALISGNQNAANAYL
jgi:hypothetical protein